MKKAKTVAGNVEVELYASSDSYDTDFTAKLVLVDIGGKAWNIVDGIIRARYKDGFQNEKLIKPGKINKYKINLGNTAFFIKKGERIRIEISSSNFPKYDRNANSKIHPFEARELKKAINTIHHSGKYPSAIHIPFIIEKDKS